MLRKLSDAMRQYPQAFAESLNAADMRIQGIAEVAIIGDPDDVLMADIVDALRQPYRPNVVVACAYEDVDEHEFIPLLNARNRIDGMTTVYVCRNFACRLPVKTAAETEALLAQW